VNKADWVAQFITELVVRTKPPMPSKFAKTVAMHKWAAHGDREPAEVGPAT
jgi:hypothetical protein